MATPHVTGSAALYAAAYPAASAQQVREAILKTARATSSLTGKTATGGRLDVGALVQAAPPAPLAVTVSSVSAPESQGVFSFVVSLNRASTTGVTVNFATANGTATGGRHGDYTATSGTLTFNSGETSKVVNVAVRNDTSVEGPAEIRAGVAAFPIHGSRGRAALSAKAVGGMQSSPPGRRELVRRHPAGGEFRLHLLG